MTLNYVAPIRYYLKTVDLTWWQSVYHWMKCGTWVKQRVEWNPVYEGQPGYEEAPFEGDFIQVGPLKIIPNDISEENLRPRR